MGQRKLTVSFYVDDTENTDDLRQHVEAFNEGLCGDEGAVVIDGKTFKFAEIDHLDLGPGDDEDEDEEDGDENISASVMLMAPPA